jgi:hypothetical protein
MSKPKIRTLERQQRQQAKREKRQQRQRAKSKAKRFSARIHMGTRLCPTERKTARAACKRPSGQR